MCAKESREDRNLGISRNNALHCFFSTPSVLSFIHSNEFEARFVKCIYARWYYRLNEQCLEMSGKGIIAKQWQRVMSEKLIERIPNRADSNIIAVYTDYESDANGEYTFLIGAKVTSADSVPEGMIAKQVPAARYAIFTSKKGPVWEVVPKIWQRTWSTLSSEMGGEKSFVAPSKIEMSCRLRAVIPILSLLV